MINILNDTFLLLTFCSAVIGFISVFTWSLIFWPYAYFKGKLHGFERNKKWDPKDDYKKFIIEKEPTRWWLKAMIVILRFTQPTILISFSVMAIATILLLISSQFL